MAFWLFKEEPDEYCFADLVRDGSTVWNGVSNALARQHLRQVRAGDRILYYHTGNQKAIVGEMRATADAVLGSAEDAKDVTVRVEPVGPLPNPVTLARIKAEPLLADWELVRLPRLSVMPVTATQWKRVFDLSRIPEAVMSSDKPPRRKSRQ